MLRMSFPLRCMLGLAAVATESCFPVPSFKTICFPTETHLAAQFYAYLSLSLTQSSPKAKHQDVISVSMGQVHLDRL